MVPLLKVRAPLVHVANVVHAPDLALAHAVGSGAAPAEKGAGDGAHNVRHAVQSDAPLPARDGRRRGHGGGDVFVSWALA
jgi:hypothetical protein